MKAPTKSEAQYLLLKIHSLTGIVPIGIFLTVHLGFNSLRTVGVHQYQIAIDIINNMPFLIWVEILFIHVPILFHSLMGFYISANKGYNARQYNYARNWLYVLQRITGAVVFLFLVFHIGTTFFPKMSEGKHLFEAAPFLIDIMNEQMATWSGRFIYLTGIICAAFHFANGLWGFSMSWGLIIGPRAQRNASIALVLVGLALSVMGIATVIEFSLHPESVNTAIKI